MAIGTSIVKKHETKGVKPQFQIGLND